MTAMLLEIVATSGTCAQVATAAGADRLEACEALELGGITPSPETLDDILAHRPHHGVHALLRSRPGNFHYTNSELRVMERQARRLARCGVDGLVLGALNDSGELDLSAISRWVNAGLEINPYLEFTMHRAIDASSDPVLCVTQLLDLGIHRVLTSGGRETAGEGMDTISQMVDAAAGRLQIMSGGGLRIDDVAVAFQAGAAAVHFSAKSEYAGTIRVSSQQVQQLRRKLNTLDD